LSDWQDISHSKKTETERCAEQIFSGTRCSVPPILRILGVDEINTVPYTPLSHLFVERLIGTIRREFLDHTLFWNATDLERQLETFRQYYNTHSAHSSLHGDTPSGVTSETVIRRADLNNFQSRSHCRDLFQLPAAL